MQTPQAQRRRRQPRRPPAAAQGRAQTPVASRAQLTEAPSTPAARGTSAGASSPEFAVLCPQPQRAFPVAAVPPQERQERPGSPAACPPAHGIDEASHELRELLGGSKGRQSPLEGNRPLSSVSTSAGPTPGPDERVSPAHHIPSAPVARERAGACSQVRKIFVGGVPQDMNQDDLYTIFSEYGGVKKAWLQRYRTNSGSNPPHNHRGFGFLIFYDGSAVEQLLGKNFSRFIMLKDGRRIEVKRAVSSSDMTNNQANASASSPPQAQQKVAPAGAQWPGAQGQVAQAHWSPDAHAQHWLAQLPPQHSMMLASVPWPGGADGAPAVMPQALPQAYHAVHGLQLPGSGSQHPSAVLLPPGSSLAHFLPGGVGRVPGPALAMAPGPSPGVVVPPQAQVQPVLAAPASGAAVPWQGGGLLYGGVVLPDPGLAQSRF